MILIALGGNETGPKGSPTATMTWSLRQMTHFQINVKSCSLFYQSAPIGQSGQPAYVNAVASVETMLSPELLLRKLKQLEQLAGRNTENLKTHRRWGPRALDLDIIDFRGIVSKNYHSFTDICRQPVELILPHPRALERPFVIRPLMEIAPRWHHPATRQSVGRIWAQLKRTHEGRILSELGS